MSLDAFAAIARSSHSSLPDGLREVKPPRLPRRVLPSDRHNPTAIFRPHTKLDTPEALARALDRERRRHATFLRNLAPAFPSRRLQHRLTEFDWRLETAADRTDFPSVLRGAGEWARVSIPHYGGPIGRAIAYYRTVFPVSAEMLSRGAVFLRFGAVDYQARVFVNGHCLGQHEGFFAPFGFECADLLHEGDNVLVVTVQNDAIFAGNHAWSQPEMGDKLYAATGLGWDDPQLGWHHCPPGFGIWQPVTLEACAPLHIADLWVRPLANDDEAEVWVEVWSKERRARPVEFRLSVFGQNFRQTVVRDLRTVPATRVIPGLGDLQKPTDDRQVALEAGPGLNRYLLPLRVANPRRWSPNTPWLYRAQVRLLDRAGRELDRAECQFGLRTFRLETSSPPRGRFTLDGEPIKLRGANTMGFEQQAVLRGDFAQLIDDILLAKLCHMNFWRLTQRPVQPEVYEYADRLGLMLQTDLPLFGCMRYSKFAEGVRQAEEMERLIRGHPSSILVSYINEPFPNANGQPHRHLTRTELEAFFTAADQAVRTANPDRVIKHVDGDYDPPSATLPDQHCYSAWYNGHGVELGKLHRGYWLPVKPGWNYACGEFGAEGLESVDLMRRRYPREWLPATDEGPDAAAWSPNQIRHAQTGKFHSLWFDRQGSLPNWVRESQRHQAWATRLFAERFRRDNRMVSFAIHLFIDAFPSGWMKTIMDCERRPKRAYFAYRDALTPLMVNIRTDRWAFFGGERMPFEFWVCNDTATSGVHLRLRWQVEHGGTAIFAHESPANVDAHASTFQGRFAPAAPRVRERTRFTLRLALAAGEKVLHDTAVDYDVFLRADWSPHMSIAVKGSGPARRLVRELGGAPRGAGGRTYLFSDYNDYHRRRATIDAAVSAGATGVFLELPVGSYEIGSHLVVVKPVMMQPRQFVSRATGHPLVAGFQPDDFRCWYDPKAGHFAPLLHTVLAADGWEPVLMSGNGEWGGAWSPAPAAIERREGAGAWRVCQVTLAGRVTHNPVANLFARRLLEPLT